MRTTSISKLEKFSRTHALLFALGLTLLLLLFYILAAVTAELLGSSLLSRSVIEACGRALGALMFAGIIVRLHWQSETGLTRLGGVGVWLLAIAVLVYEVITYVYPYLGHVDWAHMNAGDTAAVTLNALMTGPLEEFPFRGLILYAFVRLWADSRSGIWKAVLWSAVFFGASHLVHILFGRPVPQATLLAINAALGGILYAAILLRWRTIWPAVALHSGLNASATIVAFNTPGYNETEVVLLATLLFQIPLVLLSWWIIARLEPQRLSPRPA